MTSYERVREQGIAAASPVDLLAVGLARREEDVDDAAAREILQELGSIVRLNDLSNDSLRDHAGLTSFEAYRVQALLELGRRSHSAGKGVRTRIDSPGDVAYLLDHLRLEKREHFVAVYLDSKSNILRTATIHIGTVNASLVGPREVFREAVREGAVSLIVAHNHPSGDPAPSPEDIAVTERLKEVGDLLDVRLLDHVILGDRKFVSLRNLGYIT